ncbi:MAG: PAS domain-containing protein [Rhodospirillaceae bacterium]|nr:PAS domain-containing protein [Rhodospirillaceae bacterium]
MDVGAILKTTDPALLGAFGAGFVAFVLLVMYIAQRARVRRLLSERDRLEGVATRAREILATAPDGIFLWDHLLGGITCSRRLAVLLGLEAGTQARYDDIRAKFDEEALARLERHVSGLRGNGTPFDALLPMGDRLLQAVGARAETEDGQSVADIVWMRDVTAVRGEVSGTPSEVTADAPPRGNVSGLDDRHLTALLDAMPFPIWLRDSGLKLAFVNRAGEGVAKSEPEMAMQARGSGQAVSERHLIDKSGRANLMDITEVPLGQLGAEGETTGGTVGFAVDRTEREEAESALKQKSAARDAVFETLGSAVAIYGSDRRLEFFTRAYARMWSLDASWLQEAPEFGEVFEKLREARQLPEVADFRAFKAESLALFGALQSAETDMMHLPDGRAIRRTIAPHGDGGLAFAFEDLSEQLQLERSVNELSAVQRETLDNLHEGVAVFGSDGRLKLYNPVYARLWGLDEETLATALHISEVVDRTRTMVPPPEGTERWADEAWMAQRDLTVTRLLSRAATQGQQQLTSGTVIDFATVPLPDGAVLLSYLDVTDGARVEHALRQQAIAYREADRMKSEFIANVSHEVRTPMNTVIGFADMLSQNYFGELNPRQQDYAIGILNTSRGLVSIIGDILDLASIEAGQLELQRETFDAHAMLVSALNLIQERARRKELKVTFDCPTDIGWMVADERRLKQVVFNLLSNAITYTPPRGSLRLEARRNGDEIVVSVSDTGVGIPTDARERVFEAFEKGDEARAGAAEASEAGVGLGLTIVKNFVELHKGQVEVKSQPGRGTTVTCFIPAGHLGGSVETAEARPALDMGDVPRAEPAPAPQPIPASEAAPQSEAEAAQPRAEPEPEPETRPDGDLNDVFPKPDA